MESELRELIGAWRVCQDGSAKLDPSVRRTAYEYVESFKSTSTHTLEIGFYLSTNEQQPQQNELVHFGHQLIMHTIKTKWNEMSATMKNDVKTRILNMLAQWETTTVARPAYLNNSVCLLLIEVIKREWPQNWPSLLTDLVALSNRSLELKKLVFIVLKYIAEEFIDPEVACTAQLPAQRRKDINQYLSSHMDNLFGFYLDCLEWCFAQLNEESATATTTNQEKKENNSQVVIELTNTCLDSLSFYMTWLNITLILSRNYSMVNILLSMLANRKVCVNAAKCLVGLANRKGTNTERMPLLGLFNESVMQQLLNCTKLTLESSQQHDLLKHLVQILSGMGTQLNFLWQSTPFEQKPNELRLYLNAIYELVHSPNGHFSLEAISVLNALLQNEHIAAHDPDFRQLVSTLAQITSPNSYLIIKFWYASMRDSFDDELEYAKFAQRYRADLAKMVRLAAALDPQAFVKSGCEWAMKIIGETEKLPYNDLTGYDPNSFLYICWDSLIFLWNNLIQMLTKNLKNLDLADLKSKLVPLVSYSVQLNSGNANYTSFNYSFMNSLLNLMCDLCETPSDRELILKTVIEKLFKDLDMFKAESGSNTTSSSTPEESNPTSSAATIRQKIFNVRRQICASILNLCKTRSKELVPFLDPIFARIMSIVAQTEQTTQMERSILIQALFFCSNESQSYDLQLSLVKQFVTPALEFFKSNKDGLANVDAFIQLIGLDDPINSTQGIANRKQIFFYVNCLFGIMKSINFVTAPPNRGQNPDDSIHHLFILVFLELLDLVRCFNLLHSSPRVKRDYLDMTEAIKNCVIAGVHQEKHAANETSSAAAIEQQSERVLMFVCHTYETLNQLIGVYLSKLKDNLLLVEITPAGQEFIYKFGECVLSSLGDLPPFRIRSIIKSVLKTCLTLVNFDRETMQRNWLIVKLSQVMCEYFMPSVLAKISDLNAHYKSLGQDNNSNSENKQQKRDNTTQELQNQIAEENQFVLMCRDFVDLVRVFVNLNNQQQQQQQSSNNNDDDIEDENNEVMMENRSSKETSSSQSQLSELAISLLKSSKVIYQTLILLISDGLNWPDSLCCIRLVHIGSSLLERFPITSMPLDATSSSFALYLNAQIAQQVFTCCLTALQIHGEHAETASQLINLALLVYDRSPLEYRQNVYNGVLAQIPDVNKRMLNEFTVKSSLALSTDATSPSSRKPGANLTNQEKTRKDMFKKLVQPVVGKSLGQLYKHEIRIRVLEPLDLKTKRREREESLMRSDGGLGGEVNICSLFDPANKE